MDEDLRSALARISVITKILKRTNAELQPDEVEACGDILSDAYTDLLGCVDDTDNPEPSEPEPTPRIKVVSLQADRS
ncbi:hypothetical protein NX722_23405 [Endozoicomonas gorgoniicola]|uniref:Uncharacterized protein n=1 Tax=Endozoicomonas gorgoniicola TaxID=1234144 RepID=A0ABT3N1K6_9GAMM|nr:hypothetical protein [Endozoicomonas gorgoniicola]MCW7555514.1 hypothetical protein [Endozoicomonas gorgoniicola]